MAEECQAVVNTERTYIYRYIDVDMCVCACVRACVRACVWCIFCDPF